jgi:hypothetical protein
LPNYALVIFLLGIVLVSFPMLRIGSGDSSSSINDGKSNPQSNIKLHLIATNATASNLQQSSQLSRVRKVSPDNESSVTIMTAVAASKNIAGNLSSQAETGRSVKIALVSPTFTAAAYSNSFYVFYRLYESEPADANVSSQLGLLTSKITPNLKDAASLEMRDLAKKLSYYIHANVTVVSDTEVTSGAILDKSGKNLFDVIVLGHQEYVTQQEYDNLKDFVSNGGTLVLLDGNIFYAQVNYNPLEQTVTFVKGHGWAYNGKSAWKSIAERWALETRL